MKRFLLIVIFISILGMNAYSEDKVTVAVLDLVPKSVPKIISNAVSDIIRSELINIGNFTIVERSQMNAILEEQELQMTGCTDTSCAVQFGKILSAIRIVIGEVNKIDENIFITIRYVNVESGESLFSANGKASSYDDVDIVAKATAKDLAKRIVSGDKLIITPKSPKEYYLRGLVPGLGQIYAGNDMKGYIFLVSFIISGAIMGYTIYDYINKRGEYEDTPAGSPESTYEKNYKESGDAAIRANIAIGVFVLVYTANLIDIFFFSRNDLDKNFKSGVNFDYNNMTLGINIYSNPYYKNESNISIGLIKKF